MLASRILNWLESWLAWHHTGKHQSTGEIEEHRVRNIRVICLLPRLLQVLGTAVRHFSVETPCCHNLLALWLHILDTAVSGSFPDRKSMKGKWIQQLLFWSPETWECCIIPVLEQKRNLHTHVHHTNFEKLICFYYFTGGKRK